MPSIRLSGVCYAHSDSVDLLRDVHLQLEPGWTGLVGPNGAGKTTLLRLVAAELQPEAGDVVRNPAGLVTHLCAQELGSLDERLRRFAVSDDSEAHRLRGRLGLAARQLDRWQSLSPGERKRWQIAAALAERPGALLLDEPTNHLDADARDDLLAILAGYRGVGLVVSHDRELLEALTERTIRVEHGRADCYRGSYGQARETWEAALREERSSYDRLRHERDKERKRLADKRRARARAESRMRTSKNMKSAKDSDARLRGKQKRRRSAEVSLGRDVQLSRRRLDRIQGGLGGFHFEKQFGGSLFVDFERAPLPHLLVRPAGPLERAGRWLADLPELTLSRDSRIHLAGPNGAGKTSLLEELLRRCGVPQQHLLYLPQELSRQQAGRVLDEARALPTDARGRLLQVVAALGIDPERLLASEDPSPGEARKLCLASALARQVWALVLDEPTNHLDLPSIERLEQALRAYPGAVLVVSHDPRFAASVCEERWRLEDGCLRIERPC